MAGDLVLITGATGHLGFRTLVLTLEAGYQVRAAVRSIAKAQQILDAPSIKRLNPGANLTFVTVPDLTVAGAYDEAVRDVKYILHIASPITGGRATPPEKHDEVYIRPALHGTMGMLESARATGKDSSVRRIVIASSIAGSFSFREMVSGTAFLDADTRTPTPQPPFTLGGDFEAYAASKATALNAAEAWMREHGTEVAFDLIHIHPSFIVGGNELATTVRDAVAGSNNPSIGVVLGRKATGPVPGMTVHLDDASRAFVRALDPKVEGNQSFVVTSHAAEGVQWGDASAIVAKAFPEAVAEGLLPNDGAQPSIPGRADTKKTEEILGIKHLSYEEQVKNLVAHLVQVAKVPGQREELEKMKAEFATAG